MTWQMTGQMLEACSCKMFCPCVFGPAEPDQGWCSGAFVFDIQRGSADGVDLSGCKAALALDLPGDFVGGNATARLYIDSAASKDQRRELEAVFMGKKGGNWEAMSAAVSKWVPTQVTSVSVNWGDSLAAKIGDVGRLALQPIKDESGKPARILNAPLGALFGDSEDLAHSNGSQWSDPDMRAWQAGGSGGLIPFKWSA
ncbi:MAG: hypothetical protein A2148_08435 [Chloroflexi bacterium RBG_16_68_14]|nr:MAG: hypothetical protein A2148_08435 [Chloroflexi bacterium RBG_16_68_14]